MDRHVVKLPCALPEHHGKIHTEFWLENL